jgi:hypothetical protein
MDILLYKLILCKTRYLILKKYNSNIAKDNNWVKGSVEGVKIAPESLKLK